MKSASIGIARERLALYLEAEAAVLMNQAYTIGTRSFTRANLNAIRDGIKYWKGQADEEELKASGVKRNRVYRIVPRDL